MNEWIKFQNSFIERIEKNSFHYFNWKGEKAERIITLHDAVLIAKQVLAEIDLKFRRNEYKNSPFGRLVSDYSSNWIPCNEKLPDNDFYCIVTLEYPVGKIGVYTGWFDRVGGCWFVGSQLFRTNNVLAWQPFPEPYKEK